MDALFLSKRFRNAAAGSAIVLGLFFAWELGYFGNLLPRLPRTDPTTAEITYTVILILLLAFNAGIIAERLKSGTCPIGAKRATAVAGSLGVITLLCPVCLLIPVSLLGLSLSLSFLTPFMPLLRAVVMLLLIVSTILLWPKKGR